MTNRKAESLLIEAGLSPELAREAAAAKQPMTLLQLLEAARVTEDDIDTAQRWWEFLDAVPREFKLLLKATEKP